MTDYSPQEIAPGKESRASLPVAKTPTIPAAALDAAQAYAKAVKSTAFLVWRDDALEREAYFGATQADTPLVSKSLSKPLGAVLIGRAMQLGYMRSLDQPVADFIAEWRGTPKASIRIRHLLDMRSGLLPQGAAPTAEHILNRAYLSPRHDAVLVSDYPIVNQPGERFDYSNANAELIAVVIERATGIRFAKFLSDSLLLPIGAADVKVWLNRAGGLAHAGCCMHTPARTWLRLGVLLMNDGLWEGQRLLPAGFVAEMRKGTLQNPNYGLGVYLAEPYAQRRAFSAPDLPGPRVLQSEPYASADLFMFDGNSNQVVYIVPSQRLVIVRLGETPPPQPEWDNVFLPNLLLRAVAATAQSAPPRDAKNASFWQRVDHPPANPLQPPRAWYKPLAKLHGAPGPFLPTAADGSLSRQALDEAAQFAEANNSQALIVVHKGVVQLERYFGGASAASEFSSHSFAKTLNALAVGAAIADGHIGSVDQPASKWLHEWHDGKRDAITIRQLLTMSGGFNALPTNGPASHYLQLHYGADVEAIVRDAPLAYAPGSDFAYDNDNLHALGLIVERATGRPYVDYVSARIWQKLGAEDAEILLDREDGRAMAYCCVLSKPRDWARLGQMLLDRGTWQGSRILPAAWIDEMHQPSASNPNMGFQVFVGAAWMNAKINRKLEAQKATLVPANAPDLFYLSGAGGLQMAIMPKDELVILRVGKDAPAWREQVLPNLLHGALHPEQNTDWSWLYAWRLSIQQPGRPSLYDPQLPTYWPVERVAGRSGLPLPRRTGACLNEGRIAPAMAELERTKAYGFLVWHDGAIEIEHYWPGYDGNFRLESASMHKSVVGLLVGQALADGVIASVDLPVSLWLTEWSQDPRGAITVRQMLQMASGLEPIKFDATPGSPSSRFQLGDKVSAVPLAFKLADQPGEKFNYISGVTQLLALIVERASQRRYAEYLSERIWQPIGAADAFVALDHPGGQARASATLLARPEDWLRLGLLIADQGRVAGKAVIDAAWIEALASPSVANPNYGYQIWRASPHAAKRGYNSATAAFVPAREAFLSDDMLFFDGAGAQRVYVSAKDRLVMVRLGASVFDWDDAMVPNIITTAARSCPPRAAATD